MIDIVYYILYPGGIIFQLPWGGAIITGRGINTGRTKYSIQRTKYRELNTVFYIPFRSYFRIVIFKCIFILPLSNPPFVGFFYWISRFLPTYSSFFHFSFRMLFPKFHQNLKPGSLQLQKIKYCITILKQ